MPDKTAMTPRDVEAMAERLLRDATCMTAWANGVGPYPETVRGVSAKHAERAKAAAAMLRSQQAEIERLREALERIDNATMSQFASAGSMASVLKDIARAALAGGTNDG